MTAIKRTDGISSGAVPTQSEESPKVGAHPTDTGTQQAPQPPRDTSSTSRLMVLQHTELMAFANNYETLHARYAAKFPELGEPDGKPIGAKLSNLNGPRLQKSDLRPGDLLVCYEPDPAAVRPNRRLTLDGQKGDHNGLPAAINQGDFRNVHIAVWTQTPGNPKATEPWGPGEPEVVEGRAARDWKPKSIDRVQPAAASPTELRNCKVFRPTDANLGDAMAQVAMCMASGNIIYSTKELSSGGKGHYAMTPEARKKAAQIAEDAFEPDPKWALNPVNMHHRFKEGVNCTSLIVKVAQGAHLQVMRAKELEKGDKPSGFEALAEKLTGLPALNPAHVSVRTIEHFLLHGADAAGKPQYEFIGKFEMKPGEETYGEIVPPMEPKQLPPIPATDPRSNEYQAKLEQEKQARDAGTADEKLKAKL